MVIDAELIDLDNDDIDWLNRLVASWQLLADLSFGDLLLYARHPDGFIAAAQARPVTAPTAFPEDRLGTVVAQGRRPLLDRAWRDGVVCRDGDPAWAGDVPVREEAIPVVRDGRVLAVVVRTSAVVSARTPSRLELTYLQVAADLAQMVAEGRFPSPHAAEHSDASPRVGDGLIWLDDAGLVRYCSPNAVSAYRRMGAEGDLDHANLAQVTGRLNSQPVDEGLFDADVPREVEVETPGAVVRLRIIPLLPGGQRTGTLVLLRELTDVRRRERELLTKDATIREIHHRVKNNLQTVAALLRLQARRLDTGSGREELEQAVARVTSIAVVHELLSQTLDGDVGFDEIADRLITSTRDVAGNAAMACREGSFGRLPAAAATPLALVLTELMQNAFEHGLNHGPGLVTVHAERSGEGLRVVVSDDGVGLPAGFAVDHASRLGLQIVRTLVEGELDGSVTLQPRQGGGTDAIVEMRRLPAA